MVVSGLAKALNCQRSPFLQRAVNLIVSCTSRKRFGGPAETAVHQIGGANLAERLKLWKANLRSVATTEYSANDLYMGDHWSVVRSIPTEAEQSGIKVRTWICSAGYGLIGPTTPIKPYKATFTRGEVDYIASGLPEETSVLDRWWRGICTFRLQQQTGEPRTISGLAAAFPRTPMVVALSADYLKAVTPEMQGILERPYFKEHLAIVSCGTQQDHPVWKGNLLPCDASLAKTLGGALTSLNARVVRHVLQNLNRREPTVASLADVVTAIGRGNSPVVVPRVPKTDSEIAKFIRRRLVQIPNCSRTVLLREFRGQGQACEQKRFGEIYCKVRMGAI
jgi:hypothetical protein